MRSLPVLLSLMIGLLLASCGEPEQTVAPTPRPLQTAPPTPAATPEPTPEATVAEEPTEQAETSSTRAPVAGRADIDVAALKQRIDGEKDVVLIDVRTKREFDRGHIAGSKLIPTGELTARLAELTPHKGAEIHVICAVGGRSHKVVDFLVKKQGFEHVVNVKGGVKAWTRAGYPVTK